VESETMSGLAEKQMKYKKKRVLGSDFEILNFSGIEEGKEFPHASKKTKDELLNNFSKDSKIAIYESFYSEPRVVTIKYHEDHKEYIEILSQKTHTLCQQFSFVFPYPIIKSLVENFIHANFFEPIISILDEGKTLKLSDQGQGITNKSAILKVGFTTANSYHKNFIAGVGSGFPTIEHYANMSGGTLTIEDNLIQGTVVTLSLIPYKNNLNLNKEPYQNICKNEPFSIHTIEDFNFPLPKSLSERQQEVLVAVTDCGFIGPSQLAKLFEISVATAYRDLQYLECQGYVHSDAGKRTITKEGLHYLETYIFGTN